MTTDNRTTWIFLFLVYGKWVTEKRASEPMRKIDNLQREQLFWQWISLGCVLLWFIAM